MSRIGKNPVAIPNGVTPTVSGQKVSVKGPKGTLELTLVDDVTVSQGDDGLVIAPADDSSRARAMWGMQRTLVANMVHGVSEGFTKELELNGVGYRAQAQDQKLQLQLGLSHDVVYDVPQGIQVTTPKPTQVFVTGIDKQLVGQVAANIRRYRPPEPYKGKGIKYVDEYIFRKEGKKK